MCVEFGLQKNFIYFFRIGYDPLRYQRDYGNESEDKTKTQMTQSINQSINILKTRLRFGTKIS